MDMVQLCQEFPGVFDQPQKDENLSRASSNPVDLNLEPWIGIPAPYH